jgi:hypothetical protein
MGIRGALPARQIGSCQLRVPGSGCLAGLLVLHKSHIIIIINNNIQYILNVIYSS